MAPTLPVFLAGKNRTRTVNPCCLNKTVSAFAKLKVSCYFSVCMYFCCRAVYMTIIYKSHQIATQKDCRKHCAFRVRTRHTPFSTKTLLVILPYNSNDVSFENLVSDQLIIPLIDIFLYSHDLSARQCIDIVRRNSVLVINEASLRA